MQPVGGALKSQASPAEATETHSLASAGTSSVARDIPTTPDDSATSRGRLGRFVLRQLLGQGAFGRVYRAHDPHLDRFVALKVPTFDPQDKDKIQRFLTEAKAAARLRHPNIVPTYESGQIAGQYFIASEFVSGQPLSKRLKENPPDLRQAVEWTRQLAGALAYAHGEGVIHRDIKPDNIILDEKGVPQIADFGLAKRIKEDSGMTTDGAILGTPAYMAPEQARGDVLRVGAASDQYSLGVVLYEMLTGKRPFEGPTHAVIAQVISDEPPPPRSQRPEIPRDLDAICQKAMSKHSASRYASVADLANDLNRWLCGDPTSVRPLSSMERGIRWCRRHSVTMALASVTLLATVTALVAIAMVPRTSNSPIASEQPRPSEIAVVGPTSPRPDDAPTSAAPTLDLPPPAPTPAAIATAAPPAAPADQTPAAPKAAELSAAEQEDARYRSQLASAVAFFRNGHRQKAIDELGKPAPVRPAWEWRYWMALASKESVMRFTRAAVAPSWIRFSRDGQLLLVSSSSRDEKSPLPWNAIYFPDDDTWTQWSKPGGRVCAFSDDTNRILTISNTPSRNEAVPRLWAWDHRTSPTELAESKHLAGYALDCGIRDGQWLVLTAGLDAATDGQSFKLMPPLVLHTLASSTEARAKELIKDAFHTARFSNDMLTVHVLVHRGDGTFWEAFDSHTGEKSDSRQIGPPLVAKPQWVKDDGEELADWQITNSQSMVFTGGGVESPGAFVAHQGGQGADFSAVVGKIAASLDSDGQRLFIASSDTARLQIFDLAGPTPLKGFPPILLPGIPSSSAPVSLRFAPTGNRLVVALDDTLTIFDVPSAP